jgi:hypothetical protein
MGVARSQVAGSNTHPQARRSLSPRRDRSASPRRDKDRSLSRDRDRRRYRSRSASRWVCSKLCKPPQAGELHTRKEQHCECEPSHVTCMPLGVATCRDRRRSRSRSRDRRRRSPSRDRYRRDSRSPRRRQELAWLCWASGGLWGKPYTHDRCIHHSLPHLLHTTYPRRSRSRDRDGGYGRVPPRVGLQVFVAGFNFLSNERVRLEIC